MKIASIFSLLGCVLSYIYAGLCEGKGRHTLKKLFLLIQSHIHSFKLALKTPETKNQFHFNNLYGEKTVKKMKEIAAGLHYLMPEREKFSYSLLVAVHKPLKLDFERLLKALISQSACHKEVLIALIGTQDEEVLGLAKDYAKAHPQFISVFQLEWVPHAVAYNRLARAARGKYILIVDDEAWIRPDLLFRYEQVLRMTADAELAVVYAVDGILNEEDVLVKEKICTKLPKLSFPYLFCQFTHSCFLVSRKLWDCLGGFQDAFEGAHVYDLFLRSAALQAQFIPIPVQLSVQRKKELTREEQEKITQAGIASYQAYIKQLGLNWEISEGYYFGSIRAIPKLVEEHFVHAIIPYKDRKELTLKAAQTLLAQQGVKLVITALDNGSSDQTIAEELRCLGVEVLTLNEAFNFSRINNYAVKTSEVGKHCDLLYFMNNDVELEEHALAEMCRWIDAPQIGLVGCRLHYPNGLLQCGGIDIDPNWSKRLSGWEVAEKKMPFEDLEFQKLLRLSDAVNGASLLMKKSTFHAIGGYDEVWYPNAHSDTSLSRKVRELGLYCFYTPYAFGIHHESISRTVNVMEDFENTTWLESRYFEQKPYAKLTPSNSVENESICSLSSL